MAVFHASRNGCWRVTLITPCPIAPPAMAGAFGSQLDGWNKITVLDPYRLRSRRTESSTTAKEATNRQFSDYWHGFPQPTHSLTHTYIASDKLVFNNIYTYVYGGWTNDFQDYDTCGKIRYNGSDKASDYTRADPGCLWNQQQLSLRTTGFRSRSTLA